MPSINLLNVAENMIVLHDFFHVYSLTFALILNATSGHKQVVERKIFKNFLDTSI